MKKTYINPKAEYIQMDLESLIAASPEGFNHELDDDNTITPGDMLSRRRSEWNDDEEY